MCTNVVRRLNDIFQPNLNEMQKLCCATAFTVLIHILFTGLKIHSYLIV